MMSDTNKLSNAQKACLTIDYLVDAMAYHSSCPIRRAAILVDIHENPQTTQAAIMERLDISKSALNRDIDWMFNYGMIRREESDQDARKVKLTISAYSAEHVEKTLELFKNNHKSLQIFLKKLIKVLKDDKATLREAKIIAKIYEAGTITKQEVLESLYSGSPATESRAFAKLMEEGLIKIE